MFFVGIISENTNRILCKKQLEREFMLLLDIAVSFFVALLAGLGVGSGGLLIVYMTLVAGIGQIEAQGLNLLFFIAASAASSYKNFKDGLINIKNILPVLISGCVGAVVGGIASHNVNTEILRYAFAGFMIVSGVYGGVRTLVRKKAAENKST